MNTFDWLAGQNITDFEDFGIVEVSFKQGTRKGFFFNPKNIAAVTGDHVVVESSSGYDIGVISLSGDLVRLQMKKKNVKEDSVVFSILRIANERDMDKLEEARALEKNTMVRSRAIARTLGVDMKIGDVEYQGDKRKATFYYIADGRVDFRELIRHYAKEFKVKIEMRQIGSRQESALIGGLGSCGRELCCSTWLSSFKSVSTAAARYQNLAINQAKLSGQCGRLKCCLNFELDSYKEALSHFPSNAERLYSATGDAHLMKTDVFKGIMYYMYNKSNERGKVIALDIEKVAEIKEMNKAGEKPHDLSSMQIEAALIPSEPDEVGFASVNDVIDLPIEKSRKNKRRNNRSRNRRKKQGANSNASEQKGRENKSSKDAKQSKVSESNKPRPKKSNPKDSNPNVSNKTSNKEGSKNQQQNNQEGTNTPPKSKNPNKRNNRSGGFKRRPKNKRGPQKNGGSSGEAKKDA